MNNISHRRYILEFDVWEPLEKKCNGEVDKIVAFIKTSLDHCGGVRLTLESDKRV